MSTRPVAAPAKFSDPLVTAEGERRASVQLRELETLWFNTGTLCNIECANCYIESSPSNDRLVYLSADEVAAYLDEIAQLDLRTREIGFTGGEPFMNPALPDMLEDVLSRGHEALVLTNAMRPMMRAAVRDRLAALAEEHGGRLTLRVSLDHYTAELHDTERGPGSFEITLEGMRWLAEQGIRMDVAGRTCWGESQAGARDGYRGLFEAEGFAIDADDPAQLVLFPEMDAATDVPEITVDCWDILGVSPDAMMCASSRMVVKRKGAASPAVVACTLLPYDPEFELGTTLAEALGKVQLNHRWCAQFCVLGGGSCSVAD
ncbi:MAG: radical SAM protein [Acidobacteriota bacterium]